MLNILAVEAQSDRVNSSVRPGDVAPLESAVSGAPTESETRVRLMVRVWNDGKPASDVDVAAKLVGTSSEREAVKSRNGIADFGLLPPGFYKISFGKEPDVVERDVTLSNGSVMVDFDLATAVAAAKRDAYTRSELELQSGAIAALWIVNGVWLLVLNRHGVASLPWRGRPVIYRANVKPAAQEETQWPSLSTQANDSSYQGRQQRPETTSPPSFASTHQPEPLPVAGREPVPAAPELLAFPLSAAGEAPRPNTPSPTATLYAELPDNEGVFAHNNLTLDRRDGSLYEIQPRANNRSAFVTLCNNEEVQKRALLNPKALLLPVCGTKSFRTRASTQDCRLVREKRAGRGRLACETEDKGQVLVGRRNERAATPASAT